MVTGTNWDDLATKLGTEDRLVNMRWEWDKDAFGLNAERQAQMEVLMRMPVCAGEVMLLKLKPKR